jgi:hypothetical protein
MKSKRVQKSAKGDHTSRLTTRKGDQQSKQKSRLAKDVNLLMAAKPEIGYGRMGRPQPPPFNLLFIRELKRRLITSAAINNYLWTINDHFNVIGGVATSATNWIPSVYAFRLKKIEIWSAIASIGTSATCVIQDQGIDSAENDFNGIPIKTGDTSVSLDYPAHVWMKPLALSPMGSWHNGANDVTVNTLLTASSANSTIDLTYEVIDPFSFVVNQYERTIVAGTVGNFTCLGINGGTNNTVSGVVNL